LFQRQGRLFGKKRKKGEKKVNGLNFLLMGKGPPP